MRATTCPPPNVSDCPGDPESAGIMRSRGFVAGWSRSGKRVEMGMGNGQRATAQLQMLLGCINLCVCAPHRQDESIFPRRKDICMPNGQKGSALHVFWFKNSRTHETNPNLNVFAPFLAFRIKGGNLIVPPMGDVVKKKKTREW